MLYDITRLPARHRTIGELAVTDWMLDAGLDPHAFSADQVARAGGSVRGYGNSFLGRFEGEILRFRAIGITNDIGDSLSTAAVVVAR